MPAPPQVQKALARLWAGLFGNEDEAFASFEFSQLARQCHAVYGAADWSMRHCNHGERESSYLEWHEQNLRTAFRNVGAPWYGSTHPDPEKIFEVIELAYKGGPSKRIYLAPLDQAPAHFPRSEFGPCRMGRFSGEELTDILNNAVLDRFEHEELDIERLAQLSWLMVEEQAYLQPAAERDIWTQVLNTKLDADIRVVTHGRAFPAVVERLLLVLMLYPWEDFVGSAENWRPFLVPWIHPVNIDPLHPLRHHQGSILAALRVSDVAALDLPNLIEELPGLTKRDERALGSQLKRIMAHMLKRRYQPQRASRSWTDSIENGRKEIADILEQSPSLRRTLLGLMSKNYPRAVAQASRDRRLPSEAFPNQPPFSLEELLGEGR